MKPRTRTRKAAMPVAICIAAGLAFGNTAKAEHLTEQSLIALAIENAVRTLPPMPGQVIDEVKFTKHVEGLPAYYKMCAQPEDRFRCALDKQYQPQHRPRTLTLEDWANMHYALNDLHRNFVQTTDIKKHGISDKWTHGMEGDCEDFALEFKRIMTSQYNWKEYELLMGVVKDEKGGGHAVMVMRTDRGYLVADVLRNHFRRMEETNYTPQMIQIPWNRYKWASIEGRKVFAQMPAWETKGSTTAFRKKGKSNRVVAIRGTLP
ncbi:MAG: hypothetical protein EBQ96_04790 [Proteobacteria bacterium]|nr:hypothetical protein [Pseudomonadota bacterium]